LMVCCNVKFPLVFPRSSRGRHRMVVGFITTCAISDYHH
jgi:hypothetical protein